MTLANVVGAKGQVLIAKQIRDQLGIGPGWMAIQRVVDDRVEMVFLPPQAPRVAEGGPGFPPQGQRARRRVAPGAGARLA